MTEDNSEQPKCKPKEGKRKIQRGTELTIKQEKFAQGLAAGLHFAEAFRAAYNCENSQPDTVYQKSFIYKKHPKIVKRVAELKEQINKLVETQLAGQQVPQSALPAVRDAANAQVKVAERVLMDRNNLTQMLLSDRELARELGQVSAAVGAVKAVAMMHGVLADGRETKAEATAIEQMSASELRAFISSELTQVGLSPSDVGLDFVNMKPKTNALN